MVSVNTSLKWKLKHVYKEKLKVHFFSVLLKGKVKLLQIVVGAVWFFSSNCTISITGLFRAGHNSSFSVIEQIRQISKLKSEWLVRLSGDFFFLRESKNKEASKSQSASDL